LCASLSLSFVAVGVLGTRILEAIVFSDSEPICDDWCDRRAECFPSHARVRLEPSTTGAPSKQRIVFTVVTSRNGIMLGKTADAASASVGYPGVSRRTVRVLVRLLATE